MYSRCYLKYRVDVVWEGWDRGWHPAKFPAIRYVCVCVYQYYQVFITYMYEYAVTCKQAPAGSCILFDLMFNIMYKCYTDDKYNSDMIFTQLLY